MNKKVLVFLTFGCLFACLMVLASPVSAKPNFETSRFNDELSQTASVAKITINIKNRGTQVWYSYWDFVPIVDNSVTLGIAKWLYPRLVQMLGTNTIVTPFNKKALLYAFSLDITITSRPQPLTIHFRPA